MKIIDLSHPQEASMPVYLGAKALFDCLPLKIKDADGSPVRAVAVVPC